MPESARRGRQASGLQGDIEFHYGSFSRSVRLPRTAKAEDVTAKYTDGVLEVRTPLGETEEATKNIPVQR